MPELITDHLMVAFENWLMDGSLDPTLPSMEQRILLMWMSTYRDREQKDLN